MQVIAGMILMLTATAYYHGTAPDANAASMCIPDQAEQIDSPAHVRSTEEG